MGRPLEERLREYGCTEIVRLDEPASRPAQIEYLDLLPNARAGSMPGLHAVAEHQGSALLYVLDGEDERSGAGEIPRLQRGLANRSDPAWLGVARPGSLEIFPIGFHEDSIAAPLATIREDEASAPFFFQSLVHGSFRENDRLHDSDYVFEKIFGLLEQTIDEYVDPGDFEKRKPNVEPLEILSTAGRALFFRFLVDRRIVRDAELPEICPGAEGLKGVFADAESAARTSAWLDETFNGDFLQLVDESIPESDREARYRAYSRYYADLENRVGRRFFDHLHAILNGWRAAGGGFQTSIDWGDLDFAHIPVGVLSQVYESFSHRTGPDEARGTSTHYTPRNVARLMVDQVFAGIEEPGSARVLDPACGAGIFLVLAFRRLVGERWRRDGRRPDTRAIQRILYQQIRGFDISEPALRLSALALYITAIEVNASPRPPKSLKFPENLRDTVLFRFEDPVEIEAENEDEGEEGETRRFLLGSLGPSVPKDFDGSFDLVIGNPPWTRLRGRGSDEANREFTAIGRRLLRDRGLDEQAASYENPDKNPDPAFLWRAMEWAKPDTGTIALVLPARIFGETSIATRRHAWRSTLRAVSITGLVNGADLRKTPVWKAVDMPFCLLFARNETPPDDHSFYFSTPKYEPEQNQRARFRIDYEATRPVSVERVLEQPWVLKALSLGTWKDVSVVERIEQAFPRTLEKAWRDWDPKRKKTGQGYNRSSGENSAEEFLADLLDFEPTEESFLILYSELSTFREKYGQIDEDGIVRAKANWPRREALYQPPLIIIPQSPGDGPEGPKAYRSDRPLAFSQSYYGYSCAEHPEAETLAALIYLVPHSTLFAYFCLMRSRRTGHDRQTFNKSELDAIPFPDVSELPQATKGELRELAHRLEHDAEKPWDEIDSALFALYGLDEHDAQTIRDTLFAAASYRREGRAALEKTNRRHRAPFLAELREMLAPYFEVCGETIFVEEPPSQPDAWEGPWAFLVVSREDARPTVDAELLRRAMEEANRRSASRILVRAPDQRGLLVGLLDQRRWWTVTRARLCGQHILRNHLEAFGLA